VEEVISKVENNLKENYQKSFQAFGPTLRGLDWENEVNAQLRYENMLKLVLPVIQKGLSITILDVGCGYGRFLDYLNKCLGKQIVEKQIDYTGIDPVQEMVAHCKENHSKSQFFCSSLFEWNSDLKYDYVFCNGILTKKCSSTLVEMSIFTKEVVKRLYDLCEKGLYFNLFSNQVNWFENEAYYCSPVEMLAFCLQITPFLNLNHTLPKHEYFIYLYKERNF
jgi:SAM-dependent methyltransferase